MQHPPLDYRKMPTWAPWWKTWKWVDTMCHKALMEIIFNNLQQGKDPNSYTSSKVWLWDFYSQWNKPDWLLRNAICLQKQVRFLGHAIFGKAASIDFAKVGIFNHMKVKNLMELNWCSPSFQGNKLFLGIAFYFQHVISNTLHCKPLVCACNWTEETENFR